MAKYSTEIGSKHRRAKKELNNAYSDIFVRYNVKNEDEFTFELERELTDDEWHKMPNILIIYDSEDGDFKGKLKL